MTNKNFEALYTEYNELIQQFQQLQQNVGALEKHVNDLNELKNNLTSISQVQVNEEVLIPLGSGIFLNGLLKDNKTTLMNVGASLCVEKDVDDVVKTIDKQIDDTTSFLSQMQEYAGQSVNRIQELQEEFKKINSDKA